MRTLGILLLVLLILIGVLSFVAPTTLSVERSTLVDSTPARIFPYVVSLEERKNWSDWNLSYEMTTAMKGKPDGTVGAIQTWKSADAGNGEQEITAIQPNKGVDTKLRFEGRNEADATVCLEEAEGGTKVSWSFASTAARPFNIIHLFSDYGIGNSYEKSLATLKNIVEEKKTAMAKVASEKPKLAVQEVDFPATTFVAMRQKMRMSAIQDFMQKELQLTELQFDKRDLETAGNPSRLVYDWDEKKGQADIAAAVPADGAQQFSAEYSNINIPAGKALMMEFYGDHTRTKPIHDILKIHAKNNNLKIKMPIIEEFVTDPEQEPNADKWLTKVYALVQ